MRGVAYVLVACVAMATVVPIATQGEVTLSYEFSEEQRPGTKIAHLKNHPSVRALFDDDPQILSAIFFTFLRPDTEGRIEEHFSLEQWTGVLEFGERVLDRDAAGVCRQKEECLVRLDIAVNPPDHFRIIHVDLELLDVNDNAPAFPSARITATVPEGQRPGVVLPVVAATDPDSPQHGVGRYELWPAGTPFSLQQSAPGSGGPPELRLLLVEPLDREETDHYQLSVRAVDRGQPALTGSVIIDLTVADANDNAPVFEQAVYRATVQENAALSPRPLVTVHASDADTGHNGRVAYSLSRKSAAQYGRLFSLGSASGELRLTRPLDHEEEALVSLVVVAQDHGHTRSKPAYATVEVTVLDVNDHTPAITLEGGAQTPGGATVTLEEHSPPGTFVVHASLRDQDPGPAGTVTCRLSPDLPQLRLREDMAKEYTVVTETDVDREISPEPMVVTLACWDHGEPALSATATITVVLADINDHAPAFSQREYAVSLAENNAPHASVVKVTARDDDADDNGRVTYLLDSDAGPDFHVDPHSGLVTALGPLDHEAASRRQFHVIAMDGATPPRHTSALVTVTVTDRDDQPPALTQDKYIFSVAENLAANTEVGVVRAEDGDSPPHNAFTYHLDGSPHSLQLFSMDPATGAIFTTRPLDREQWEVYHMIAYAQSLSSPPQTDSAEVDIYITDRNDHPPTFSFPNPAGNDTVHLHSNVPLGYPVARVEAVDADSGDNARLTFAISEGSESGEFEINAQTGEIQVKTSLADYAAAVFRLVLMVEDAGTPKKISVTTLNIVVSESNGTYASGAVKDQSGLTTSPSHLHMIIGVVAGCLLISVILVVAIVMMKKRHRRKPAAKTSATHYWPETSLDKDKELHGMSGNSLHANGFHGNGSLGDKPLVLGDIALGAVKTDTIKQSSCKLGADTDSGCADSGCADVSHTESQGSGEDPDTAAIHAQGPVSPRPGQPPRRMDSFSNWLHSENYHLSQKGNVYRVSEQGRPSGGSPGAKKTVRFSEEEDPALPPPPPQLSPEYYSDAQPAFTYPQPQEGTPQHSPYTGPPQDPYSTTQYGSLTRNNTQHHGYYGNNNIPVYDTGDGTIVVVPDSSSAFSGYKTNNDGSLV